MISGTFNHVLWWKIVDGKTNMTALWIIVKGIIIVIYWHLHGCSKALYVA